MIINSRYENLDSIITCFCLIQQVAPIVLLCIVCLMTALGCTKSHIYIYKYQHKKSKETKYMGYFWANFSLSYESLKLFLFFSFLFMLIVDLFPFSSYISVTLCFLLFHYYSIYHFKSDDVVNKYTIQRYNKNTIQVHSLLLQLFRFEPNM